MICHALETSDGARLHWVQEGDGPTLLLVHGGTGTGAFDWELVWERLVAHHRLVVPDLRGHGRSSDPQGRLGMGALAEDLVALIEQAGGCDAIVAFSIGASTALGLLARRPQLTRAFVCIGASMVGDPERLPVLAHAGWPAELRALHHEHGGPEHWRTLRHTLVHAWAAEHRVTPGELAALTLPTLVVCGDRDRVEPVETALSLSRRLPAGELFVAPRCGHFVARERPDELAEVVLGFLQRTLGES